MHTAMANLNYQKDWKTFLKCKECWEFKELCKDNWYSIKWGFLWVLSRCKDCIKKWRKSEYERVMARKRDNDRYYNNPKRREYIFKSSTERRKRKWYANIHLKTDRLINKLWIRPCVCSICWWGKRVVSHHPDYSKPFEVVFCCDICHSKIHHWEISNIDEYIIDLTTYKSDKQ